MKTKHIEYICILCVLVSLGLLCKLQYEKNLYYYGKLRAPEVFENNSGRVILKEGKDDSGETLKLHAKSACLMDAGTDRILYSKDADKKLPMASTTKIMTCIIALEQMAKNNATDALSELNSGNGAIGSGNEAKYNDKHIATVSKYAAGMPDVQLNVNTGEKYYIEDLLYSLMLESHNDVAVVIAEYIGGSVEGFAGMMNEKAA